MGADDARRRAAQCARRTLPRRDAGLREAATHVLARPGGIAWNNFDARLLALARGFPDFVVAEAAGAVRMPDDGQALAVLVGRDAEVLASTMSGTSLHPPCFAIRVTGALFHTQGGLDVDAACRVLSSASFKPLPNLWAAGGAARGVSERDGSGHLSGNGVISAVAGGFVAAATLAQ